MSSYLLSWWYGKAPTHNVNESGSESNPTQVIRDQALPGIFEAEQATPRLTVIGPDIEDAEYTGEVPQRLESITTQISPETDLSTPDDSVLIEEYDDVPPAYPSLNSIQRSQSGHHQNNRKYERKSDTELMPPPSTIPVPTQLSPSLSNSKPMSSGPIPSISGLDTRFSSVPYAATLRIPAPATSRPSPSSSLLPPPTTTRPPPALSKVKRAKVMLAPGHSPLDWAALKASGKDLRGTLGLLRVTPSVLRQHKTIDDAWTAINGRVYNVTPYLDYHPGGVKELMRVAGRDGTKLFALTHAWVNAEFMLDECFVGFLVPEGSVRAESSDEE